MSNASRSKADQLFAKNLKRDKEALKEKDKRQQEMSKKTATLRALRLAKEAADKEAAEQAAAEKKAAAVKA
jgi:hypothetical protein